MHSRHFYELMCCMRSSELLLLTTPFWFLVDLVGALYGHIGMEGASAPCGVAMGSVASPAAFILWSLVFAPSLVCSRLCVLWSMFSGTCCAFSSIWNLSRRLWSLVCGLWSVASLVSGTCPVLSLVVSGTCPVTCGLWSVACYGERFVVCLFLVLPTAFVCSSIQQFANSAVNCRSLTVNCPLPTDRSARRAKQWCARRSPSSPPAPPPRWRAL